MMLGVAELDKISFLDVQLGIYNRIYTDLYRKPLSGNTLLMAQSGHPRHTIKGIPVGRIFNSQESFEMEAQALYNQFLSRGYPRWMLDRACNIASSKDRLELLGGGKGGWKCMNKNKIKQGNKN